MAIWIRRITCSLRTEDKIESKHGVTLREVEQVLLGSPRIRFAEKGHVGGEDVYVAFGQIHGGRYLVVFFVYKPAANSAMIISARQMRASERRRHDRR